MNRTDKGNVKISRSTGRKNDYIFSDNQRYKNINSENNKLDYMTANFCVKP